MQTDQLRATRETRMVMKQRRVDVALTVLGMARGKLDSCDEDDDQAWRRRDHAAAELEEAATALLVRFLRGR